jgi:hypothetical protein
MGLKDLTDAELGHIVRDSPLWQILLAQEDNKRSTAPAAGQDAA